MQEKNRGRLTRQRRVILDELRSLKTHPTADELYNRVRKTLPRISLGTVYRNLETLSESGDIRKLEFGGGQMRFDGDVKDHYHIRCLRCGRVGDIPAGLVEKSVCRKKHVGGFTVLDCDLHFTGVCDQCGMGNEQDSL